MGREFATLLKDESREKFAARLAAVARDPEMYARPVELNHVDNATWEFPVRYNLHPSGAQGALLLVGRDMQPIAEMQQRLVSEQISRERDQQKLRGAETLYRVVLEASETPLVLLEPRQGLFHDLNTAAAALPGTKPETLRGNAFAQASEGRRRTELMDALQTAAGADEVKGVEVVARRNGRAVMLMPEYFRAAGELFLLCRLVSIVESDSAGPEAARSLSALFAAASDAIVLTFSKGMIRDANEAFLIMTDAAQLRDVKDASLADFLVRGAVDLKLLLDTAAKTGRVRSYAAQVSSVVGTRAMVDISVARLRQRAGVLGFGFIIRDVTPDETPEVDPAGSVVSEDAMRNVMDRVGTASLKELVSATSDVVEKICIETAVQLTGNNRVAAAEMLGLSRQSLYVKLRKHGLLNTGADGDDRG